MKLLMKKNYGCLENILSDTFKRKGTTGEKNNTKQERNDVVATAEPN